MVEVQLKVGFLGILGLLFICLKLMHYIDWSWLVVLSPLWLPFVIALVFFAIGLIIWGFWWIGDRTIR